MKAPFSYLPSLPALIGIIGGILFYHFGAGLIAACIAVVVFAVLYKVKRHYFAFVSLFAAIGLLMSIAHKPADVPEWIYEGDHTFTADINSAKENGSVIRCYIRVVGVDNHNCTPINAQLTIRSLQSGPQTGATIRFKGRLESIDQRPPIVVPYETDYRKYLKSEGVTSYAVVNNVSIIKAPGGFDKAVNDINDGLYNSIVYSPINGATASFILATAIGDDTYITQEKYDQYRATGIAHILALSGLHVGILVSFIASILFPLKGLKRGGTLRAIITIILIWAYTVIVGFAPSILRAAVMITVFVCAMHIQRGYNALNSLSLSIIIILCINPLWLWAPGFQLSVAAVASILMFGNVLPKSLRKRPLIYYPLNLMLIPVAAMLGTGIVSAYHFGTFAGMFLIGNIITGLIFPWILIGGIILAIFTACGINASWLGWIVDTLYSVLEQSVDTLASIEGTEIRGIYFSAWVILPYSLMLVSLAYAIKHRTINAWILTAVFLFGTIITERQCKEELPIAELYIPAKRQSTNIIMREGNKAWLKSFGNDAMAQNIDCNKRYQRFLMNRHCGDTFINADTDKTTGIINFNPDIITIGTTTICIVNSDTIIARQGQNPTYALIGRGYNGTLTELYKAVKPDTILMMSNMIPSQRKMVIAQCGDSIPYIDLRKGAVAIKLCR